MNRITDPRQAAREFLETIRQSRCAVALTGAGVSTASGIPDFRGAGGLYSKISPQTFEIDFLMSSPADYYKIAIEHIHPLVDKDPNPLISCWHGLSRRTSEGPDYQNIDGLHGKAVQNVVVTEMWSNLLYECENLSTVCLSIKRSVGKLSSCDLCGSLIARNRFFGV